MLSSLNLEREPPKTIELVLSTMGLPPQESASQTSFLNDLISRSIILPEQWDELDPAVQVDFSASESQSVLLSKLVTHQLLTEFQTDMISRGASEDLKLGQYRLLGILGRGGMGVVYRGEHIHLRREVAVKVFANTADTCPRLLRRFQSEARAAARILHPNLVACRDAGRVHSLRPNRPIRDYFVMELVHGKDLDALVRDCGPLPVTRVIDLFRQVAEGLTEAHRYGLIHRDIKPPNIIITPDWRAKLLDFGLALHPHRRTTEPGTILGTIGYMAPEQAREPHTVDARADLFSLGAAMYWALTGHDPFPETGNLLRDLQTRMTTPPPIVQRFRPEIPEELGALVNRMLSIDADLRPPSARVVATTLTGLSQWISRSTEKRPGPNRVQKPNVVIVEDDPALRKLLRLYIEDEFQVSEAGDGDELRNILQTQQTNLIVLDVELPGVSGDQLLALIRSDTPDNGQPMILLTSGVLPPESLGGLLASGADDFLAKPFTREEFRSRVGSLIKRQIHARNQADSLILQTGVADLTRTPMPVGLRRVESGAIPAGIRVLMGIYAQMSRESLSIDPAYGERFSMYIQALAFMSPGSGEYSRLKDQRFLDLLTIVSPLHDIGMMAVPRTILEKPGTLNEQELLVIQAHPVMGSEWVTATAVKCPSELAALSLAADVIRSHHEHWDGSGYPDGLAGTQIPLAGRIVNLISVYSALRSPRPFRQAFSHASAIRMIMLESGGQFDPTLVYALNAAAPEFEKIFHTPDY